jgi:hypothetical protein
MHNQKFQISVEFPDDGPEIAERLSEAEGLLWQELSSGTIAGNETAVGWARLFITTASPITCLAEIDRRLSQLHMVPTITTCQGLDEDSGTSDPTNP